MVKSNGDDIFMGRVEFCPAALSVCVCACVKDFMEKGVTVSVGFKEVIVALLYSFNRSSLCSPGKAERMTDG